MTDDRNCNNDHLILEFLNSIVCSKSFIKLKMFIGKKLKNIYIGLKEIIKEDNEKIILEQIINKII